MTILCAGLFQTALERVFAKEIGAHTTTSSVKFGGATIGRSTVRPKSTDLLSKNLHLFQNRVIKLNGNIYNIII